MELFDVDGRSVRRLLPGDLLAILVFVLLGEYSHYGAAFLSMPLLVAGTYVPFAVGWVFAGSALGAYSGRARESLRATLLYTGGSWLVADAVAQTLRALPFFHGDAALTFYLVAAAVGGVLLVGWRVVAVGLLEQ